MECCTCQISSSLQFFSLPFYLLFQSSAKLNFHWNIQYRVKSWVYMYPPCQGRVKAEYSSAVPTCSYVLQEGREWGWGWGWGWGPDHRIYPFADMKFYMKSGNVGLACWLLNVPATCECISGTDLLRQFYVLPHWDRSCRSNFPSHPVTVYWHWADQSQRWPYNARRLAGQPLECQFLSHWYDSTPKKSRR